MRTGARPRLVEGLLLRPDARGEPGLAQDTGSDERSEFGALLDLAAGENLGMRLADLQGDEQIVQIRLFILRENEASDLISVCLWLKYSLLYDQRNCWRGRMIRGCRGSWKFRQWRGG